MLTRLPVLGKASQKREKGRDSRHTPHILRSGAEELSQAWACEGSGGCEGRVSGREMLGQRQMSSQHLGRS